MKKDIIIKYRNAAQEGGKEYWDAVRELNELKKNEDKYFKPRYSQLLGEATMKVSNAESKAKQLIAQARKEAEEMIKSTYALDGEQINENTVKLLKSGVVLSPAEINNLMKNAKSVTMQRIINDYAQEHGISTGGKFIPESEALAELDALDSMARSGLQRDFYFNDVINNNEAFEQTAGECFTGQSFVEQ